MRKDFIDYLPGVETIDPKEESEDTSTMFHQLISASFIDAKGADFVLCNTVQLGPFLQLGSPILSWPLAYGPSQTAPNGSIPSLMPSPYNRSVLEKLQMGFCLVMPNVVGSIEVDPLPVGFREAIRDRGMVIPWCSQTQVLAHPAIGAFGVRLPIENKWWIIGSDPTVIAKEEVSKNVSRLMGGPLGDQLKDYNQRDQEKNGRCTEP
ncbi:hypothetical protein Ahy_A03g014824 [Arachis hypogaea]|uniref:Uncharacterized protein n=1 Tax=Arachis hypogaea TaxID=3818 RepID=A0A445DYU6_ARAHY|nr:hypothetical protein Ahy_A03g014824 [Arachis hypogaea]